MVFSGVVSCRQTAVGLLMGTASQKLKNRACVPQGSVLGLLLFIIYIINI